MHIYFRIWPAMLFTIALINGLSSFIVKGPKSVAYHEENLEACRNNYWFDLTFSSNIVMSSRYDRCINSNGTDCLAASPVRKFIK